MHLRTTLFLMLAVTLPLGLSGCGSSGGPSAKVTGKVTYQNGPVPKGYVILEDADGEMKRGQLMKDGTFTIPKVAFGSAKVAIQVSEASLASHSGGGGKAPGADAGSRESQSSDKDVKPVAVPPKYKSTGSSGLSYTITDDPSSWELDIKLD